MILCAVATPSTSLSGSSPYAPMGPEGRASALTGRVSGCEVRRAFPAIEAQSAIQPPGVFPHGPERSSIAPHRLPPPGARWRFLQSHFSARPSLAVLVQPRPSTCSPVSATDSRLSLLPLHHPMMLSSSEPSPIFRTLDLSQSVSTRRTHLCWLLQSGPGYAPQRRFKARFRGLIKVAVGCPGGEDGSVRSVQGQIESRHGFGGRARGRCEERTRERTLGDAWCSRVAEQSALRMGVGVGGRDRPAWARPMASEVAFPEMRYFGPGPTDRIGDLMVHRKRYERGKGNGNCYEMPSSS